MKQASLENEEQVVASMIVEEQQKMELPLVHAIPIQRSMRESIQPFLPPPMVKAMNQVVDPMLKPYMGEEATMTILMSLFLALFVWQFVKVVSTLAGTSKAIVDDENEDEQDVFKKVEQQSFQMTLLLLGPSTAGKTRLFMQLCHGLTTGIQTAISLRTNVGVCKGIRFMDIPGHFSSSLSSSLRNNNNTSQLQNLLQSSLSSRGTRIIFMLDSTQSIVAAADILFQVIISLKQQKKSNNIPILVVCNKVDMKNAKNWRRLKIQLRTEMERLLKVTENHDLVNSNADGEPFNLEHLANIAFLSTSLEDGTGMQELVAFVEEGKIPEQKTRR